MHNISSKAIFIWLYLAVSSKQCVTLCILMDCRIYIDTISMCLPILYLKGLQIEFSESIMYISP